MSKSKQKPWELKWRRFDQLGKGGQGTSFYAQKADERTDAQTYVLKVLNRQNDDERRGRFYREVATLRTLHHEGIASLIDSNAEYFENKEQDLYLVTEFIPGPTLEEHVGQAKMILGDAVRLLLWLTGIVQYCHERGVVHRDIKLDNIVLKNGDYSKAVLLDFGLSFNEELEEAIATPSSQQLGNRFLALPELQTKSAGKRDQRSDVTQLCGILIYVLTAEHPVTLMDAELRLPHQRPHATTVLAAL